MRNHETGLWGGRGLPQAITVFAALAFVLVALFPNPAHADGGAPNLAYVAGAGPQGDEVAVVDISKQRVTMQITVGGGPRALLLSADARYLYVTQSSASSVAVVDTHAGKVVAEIQSGRNPESIALDLSGSGDAFVANGGDGTVSVLDLTGRRNVATIHVGQHPMSVAVAGPDSGISDPTSSEVYVANQGSNSVTVISASMHNVLATIAVPGGPSSIVVPASGGVAYVATQSGAVYALSLARHTLLGTLLRLHGAGPDQMDYDAITGQVYVSDPSAGVVDILRPAEAGTTGAVTLPPEPARTLPAPGGPVSAAITFDGAYAFIAAHDSGALYMVDAPSHQRLTTLQVGGHPQGIITGSYPPVLGQQAAFYASIALYTGLGLVFLIVIGFVLGWHKRFMHIHTLGARKSAPKRPS
jgi:YVTN family beta-propeller protein